MKKKNQSLKLIKLFKTLHLKVTKLIIIMKKKNLIMKLHIMTIINQIVLQIIQFPKITFIPVQNLIKVQICKYKI